MEKTVELVLKSEHAEERVEIPAGLWEEFEQKAQELQIAPEELFPMLLGRFLKDPDVIEKVTDYIEEEQLRSRQPWAGWFKAFMEEWRKQAGNKVECDADTEDMLLMEFYHKGKSPSEAVAEMVSD